MLKKTHDQSLEGEDSNPARRKALCQIIERWRLHREVYSEFTHLNRPRWVIYGYLPNGHRVVLAVFGETERKDESKDLIDLFLRHVEPDTAHTLEQDLASLMVNLKNLEECEEIIPYQPDKNFDPGTYDKIRKEGE
jgi:hypothetical protein